MTDVQPDNKAAIDFLLRVYPEGPWLLTAIQTDRKAISTETFFPTNLSALEGWLKKYNGHRNIYWSVNPPMRPLTKKAEREDIAAVHYLHVDVDPRAGEDLDQEIARIRALRPSGLPEPSFTIYSGGGCQFFWKLQEPIEINGNIELAEEAKRYNQHIEVCYGGDNCHNIDRIMRLPGTVNVPDAKKLKKGRKPALAVLLSWNDEGYPLDRFPKAATVQLSEIKGAGGAGGISPKQPQVQLSGNITRLADVDELDQWGVEERIKLIIVQGEHPDEPKRWTNGGRSEWVLDVVCNLLRRNVPDDIIYSIITDPEFKISSSVLEGGARRAHRYAIRQISRAKEFTIDPKLMEFNERYAIIRNIGGKCRVIEEVQDPVLKRARLTRISFEDFRNAWCNDEVKVGTNADGKDVFKPAGEWWIKHKNRRTYDTIVFAPEYETPTAYNLWRGFAVEQKPGECAKFLHHVRENICAGVEEHYQYLLGWMARAVQRPAEPGYVAIVLRGEKGTGKGVFAKTFGALFGRHFLQVANPGHLVGNFNAHLRDVCVLFADEAFYANDKKHESVLKMLVTEETIPIEAKGVDVESCPNYVHLIMASNEDHVVPASGKERRYFVLQVGEGKVQNGEYFEAIRQEMDNGGKEALLHYLRTFDLSNYKVAKVPQTDALRDQKERSFPAEADWLLNKLQNGAMFERDAVWPEFVRKQQLFDDYTMYFRNWSVNTFKRLNMTTLGKFIKELFPGVQVDQRMCEFIEPDATGFGTTVLRRQYGWVLPSLSECRAAFERKYGEVTWQEPLSGGDQPRLGKDTPF